MSMRDAEKQSMHNGVDEFAKAYSLAKKAIEYVSQFQTPPTPEVYEVWYRFAEGNHAGLNEFLSHLIDTNPAITSKQLGELHQQFVQPSESQQLNQKFGQKLVYEIAAIDSLIQKQLTANDKFSGSMATTNRSLHGNALSLPEIKECMAKMLESNEMLQRQVAEMSTKMQHSQNQVEGLRRDLLESHKMLVTDPLTGIGNRRFFESMLELAIETSQPDQACVYLLLIDLDNFKSVNDSQGHPVGDEILKFVSHEIQNLAPDASVARIGGDEFALVSYVDDVAGGQALADSLCQFFSEKTVKLRKSGQSVGQLSISVGASLLRHADSRESWFERADKLLYSAKNSGRNRAMVERNIRS